VTIPFSEQQFFQVFARYNEAVWPAQVALYTLAFVALFLALREGRTGRHVSAILAFLWAWMALAYHAAFFREINPAATLFGAAFLLQAALFIWYGVVQERITFASRGIWAAFGAAFIAYALLVYPVFAVALGQRYPQMPTFGLPCPTTIFTIGLLLYARPGVPRLLWLIPVLWSVIATQAALVFGVREDFALPIAALVAIIATYHRRAERYVSTAPTAGAEVGR
jgi:hypothetical protein